ncbi:MAG: hypothetical protein H7061_12920 [Bdellovibrionaceae bacterium]|nr:hypothetical protein [Bdellovibrio sp.]
MPAVQIQTEDQKAESVSLMIKSLLGAAAEIRQTQSVKDVEMLWGSI